jgi:two-component system, OmpR family, phosphate regulon sensor histidine kinase PhoR
MSRKLILLYGLMTLVVCAAMAALFANSTSPYRTLALAVIAILVILVPGLLRLRSINTDVREVTNAARKIATGQYGFLIKVPGLGDAGELGRAFNSMSADLAEQFARVEQDSLQLRAVLGGMIEGVVAIDAQQRLLFANERGGQLLGFNMRTAVGLRFWEVVRQRSIVAIVEKAMEKGESLRQEFDWKGNPAKTLLVHVSPLRENPGGAIVVVHDTSDLRRLERLRHEFVANVSHELKTPLAVIKASVETLLDGAVDDTENRGMFLAQILDQAERLNNLILDMLSLARIESGSERLQSTRVVLSEAVQECFDRHAAQAESRKQHLEMLPPQEPSAAEMRTDEEALAQILDNLVDNALKYTQEGSHIRIHWYGLGDQICIEVQDDGPGIPEEDQPRIFERFYRVDKARSRELGGTGLGLAIVKNLAQVMKGGVSVHSQPGKGATFTVSLPRMLQ